MKTFSNINEVTYTACVLSEKPSQVLGNEFFWLKEVKNPKIPGAAPQTPLGG